MSEVFNPGVNNVKVLCHWSFVNFIRCVCLSKGSRGLLCVCAESLFRPKIKRFSQNELPESRRNWLRLWTFPVSREQLPSFGAIVLDFLPTLLQRLQQHVHVSVRLDPDQLFGQIDLKLHIWEKDNRTQIPTIYNTTQTEKRKWKQDREVEFNHFYWQNKYKVTRQANDSTIKVIRFNCLFTVPGFWG